MTTKHLTAEERNAPAFRHTRPPHISYPYDAVAGGRTEPALGTLDERLGILVRRFGGRTRLAPSGEDIEQYREAS